MSSGDDLTKDVSVWADVYTGNADIEKTKHTYGFDFKNNGVIFGLEKEVSANTKYGVGYQHDKAKIDSYNRKIDAKGNGVFAYAEHRNGPWRMSATALYDHSKYEEKKYVLGEKYNADYDVDAIVAQVLAGYEIEAKGGNLVPQLGLRYSYIDRDRYTDGANQKVSSKDMDVITAVVGVNFAKEMEIAETTVTPEVYFGATYDVKSDKDDATVRLSNGSSYTVDAERLNRFGTEFGVNVVANIKDNIDLKLHYLGSLRKDYQSHSLSLGLKYNL